MIDLSTDFGARVARRLGDEIVIWLTTVRADGTPQPSVVWFLWEHDTFLIYSQSNKQKLRNIARNPKVSLNFDGNGRGGDLIIFSGEAQQVDDVPAVDQNPSYIAKYQDQITRIGYTVEQFAKSYSVALRVVPTHLRGH
jgi:PPOX class probable F420-dependent enzyme